MTGDCIASAALAWADDLFLHSHQLIRWVTDYVDLEESLAIGSVAQEELAHANVLFEQAGCTVAERDWRIFARDPGEWFPSRLAVWPVDDWPTTVARGFLLTHGTLVFLAHLQQLGGESIGEAAAVVEAEQRLHARHWWSWVDILAWDLDTGDMFREALAAATARCTDLFGFAAGPGSLDPQTMGRLFRDVVGGQLAGLVAVPPLPADVAVPRQPGSSTSELGHHLALVRQVRDAHPDRVYGIYR